ncbi:MAG: prepilin-type N-terminal cleavage/methylation domain-containing protein [Bacilli bacterium]|nr:prepilin-type N-terminal cleavage/methylation domain-containing protein [Bacilli bacterium]
MKKGFTLIELLAVILILGIIALIAIPTVTNIIEEARMGAFRVSVNEIANIAEQNCQVEGIKNLTQTTKINFENGNPSINLDYKGTSPDSGFINLSKDCASTFKLADSRYCAVKDSSDGDIVISKVSEGNCNIEDNVAYTPDECFVFDSSTGTIKEYLCGEKNGEKPAKYYPDVVIPKKINGVTVKHIGEQAFSTSYVGFLGFTDDYIYARINSIVFPDTLETIAAGAFYENDVTYFNLPSSLKLIEREAFDTDHEITIELGHLAYDFTPDNYYGLVTALYSCEMYPNKWTVKYNALDDNYKNFMIDSGEFVEGEPSDDINTFKIETYADYQLFKFNETQVGCE